MNLVEQFEELVKRARELVTGSPDVLDFIGWQRDATSILDEAFGTASPEVYEFTSRIQPILERRHHPATDFREVLSARLARAVHFLEGVAIALRAETKIPRRQPSSPTEGRDMTREELLSRLSKLLPSQFEQVLFLARIPHEHLPAATAAQALRAVELMRYVELQNQLDPLARIVQWVVTGDGQAVPDRR
jgi:hypothetical protein